MAMNKLQERESWLIGMWLGGNYDSNVLGDGYTIRKRLEDMIRGAVLREVFDPADWQQSELMVDRVWEGFIFPEIKTANDSLFLQDCLPSITSWWVRDAIRSEIDEIAGWGA